jgi:DnaK suppressor protein
MARKDAVAKMREVLMKRRTALRKALAGDISGLSKVEGQSGGDVVDAALDSAQDEITSQLAEVESRELASIESALERMREGTYGKCEACGGAIPLARLQALPYAVLCIHCQQEAEDHGGVLPAGGNIDWKHVADSSRSDREVSFSDIEMDVP